MSGGVAVGVSGYRLAGRQERSAPIVDAFFVWVKGMSQNQRPKSKFSAALGYAINQESRMRLFLAYGDVPMNNNISERLLRQPIVGRKNWLFAGSEGGAIAAAGWFTVIGSCRLQGIDPVTYLYDAFRRLPDYPAKWVHELTPLNWRLAVEAGDITPFSPGQLV
jgi:transposase